MKRWAVLFFIMALLAAPAVAKYAWELGTVSDPAADDWIIVTDVSDTETMSDEHGAQKRIFLSDFPISTAAQSALDGKQDASAALDAYSGVPPSAAVLALLGAVDNPAILTLLSLYDSATVDALIAAATAFDADQDGDLTDESWFPTGGLDWTVDQGENQIADSNIPDTIARSTDLDSKMNVDPGGTADQMVLGDGSFALIPTGSDSTITADGTDPTKAAQAVLADTVVGSGITGTVPESVIDSALARLGAVQAVTGAWTFSTTPTFTNGMGPNIWTFESSLPSGPVAGLEFATDAIGYDAMGYYGSDGTTPYYLISFTGSPEDGYGPVWRDATGWGLEEAGPGGGSTIDDTAGDGDTDVNWSADKSYDEIATLTTLVNALQAAVDGAGLNAFTWIFTTPSNTPYYVNSTSATFAFSITDTSSSADPDSVLFQVNSGGYGTNDCGSLTGCTVSGLTENSSNTVQFQVSDDATTPNTGESQEFTVISDTSLPVGGADVDGTHNNVDTFIGGVTVTETNIATVTYVVTNATPASGSCTLDSGSYWVTPTLTPTAASDAVITYTITDLAGNTATGTDLVQEFTYSSGETTYYVGYNNDHTTTMVTTAPTSSSTTSVPYGFFRAPTVPIGATIVAVHVYCPSSANITAWETAVHAYTDGTTGGVLYASGTTTISDSTWVRVPISGSTTYFSSAEQVYVGVTWTSSGSVQIGREDTGGSGWLNSYLYGDDPLGVLNTNDDDYAIVLEYTL